MEYLKIILCLELFSLLWSDATLGEKIFFRGRGGCATQILRVRFEVLFHYGKMDIWAILIASMNRKVLE